uniref:potassium channel subfamily K member 16-like n=1 Tax=Myxine glutinosa TaxID=7769 RepID=UPI00358EA411
MSNCCSSPTNEGCLSRIPRTLILIVLYFIFLVVGAAVFRALERTNEEETQNALLLEELSFLKNYDCLDIEAVAHFVLIVLKASNKGIILSGNKTSPSNWDFNSAFFFSSTVITTIGYGHLSPSTVGGRIFCIFFALLGIPLNIITLNHVGVKLSNAFNRLSTVLNRKNLKERTVKIITAVLFFVSGFILFFFIPSIIFAAVEGWTYGESVYYSFVTLSTIGFGDYVAGSNPDKTYIQVYRSMVGFWILFGMAWLAGVFNNLIAIFEKTEKKMTKKFEDSESPKEENAPSESNKDVE